MALLGESLVEEWLNRDGFFTIRGVRHGVEEMDLLAIRREKTGTVIGWHVEVQISFRPVGYIAKLPKGSGVQRTSVRARTLQEVDQCAKLWVEGKFRSSPKVELRKRLWPGVKWAFHFVHGVVRDPHELKVIESQGIKLHPFHEILDSLSKRGPDSYSASAGGDLAEIVTYYKSHGQQSQ